MSLSRNNMDFIMCVCLFDGICVFISISMFYFILDCSLQCPLLQQYIVILVYIKSELNEFLKLLYDLFWFKYEDCQLSIHMIFSGFAYHSEKKFECHYVLQKSNYVFG